MNLKKIFNVNNGLALLSIAASVGTTISACDSVKKNKNWKGFILPSCLFLISSGSTIALAIRGNRAEAKIIMLTTSLAALGSNFANYRLACSNVYGDDAETLIHRQLVDMSGKEKPKKEDRKDICWIGYGYNDYLLLSSEEKEKIESEMNKILRIEGCVTVSHFFDLCSQYNIIDDVIVQANKESSLYGWDTVMVGRRGYIAITEEIYNDGADDVSYLDFDIQPSMNYRQDADIAPWEE